jgi:uncharacterized protein (TIGR02757 family)
MSDLAAALASLYRRYNRRSFVHPDPLELLYEHEDPEDQEIVGLVAACLAYGRVAQIIASVRRALATLMPPSRRSAPVSPRAALLRASEADIRTRLAGFTHRFTTGPEMASLLIAARRAIREHRSLEALFRSGMAPEDRTILPALTRFVASLRGYAGSADACASLLSSPADGSACKRLNLYLRWMVRRDAVDPGPWASVSPALLVVPLDTHMFRIAGALGLTERNQPNLKTALEITEGFALLSPHDPVRYDFSLTRLGINPACGDPDLHATLSAPAGGRRRTGGPRSPLP